MLCASRAHTQSGVVRFTVVYLSLGLTLLLSSLSLVSKSGVMSGFMDGDFAFASGERTVTHPDGIQISVDNAQFGASDLGISTFIFVDIGPHRPWNDAPILEELWLGDEQLVGENNKKSVETYPLDEQTMVIEPGFYFRQSASEGQNEGWLRIGNTIRQFQFFVDRTPPEITPLPDGNIEILETGVGLFESVQVYNLNESGILEDITNEALSPISWSEEIALVNVFPGSYENVLLHARDRVGNSAFYSLGENDVAGILSAASAASAGGSSSLLTSGGGSGGAGGGESSTLLPIPPSELCSLPIYVATLKNSGVNGESVQDVRERHRALVEQFVSGYDILEGALRANGYDVPDLAEESIEESKLHRFHNVAGVQTRTLDSQNFEIKSISEGSAPSKGLRFFNDPAVPNGPKKFTCFDVRDGTLTNEMLNFAKNYDGGGKRSPVIVVDKIVENVPANGDCNDPAVTRSGFTGLAFFGHGTIVMESNQFPRTPANVPPNIFAHEMGHLWGLGHVDPSTFAGLIPSNIMSAFVNAGNTTFTLEQSMRVIASRCGKNNTPKYRRPGVNPEFLRTIATEDKANEFHCANGLTGAKEEVELPELRNKDKCIDPHGQPNTLTLYRGTKIPSDPAKAAVGANPAKPESDCYCVDPHAPSPSPVATYYYSDRRFSSRNRDSSSSSSRSSSSTSSSSSSSSKGICGDQHKDPGEECDPPGFSWDCWGPCGPGVCMFDCTCEFECPFGQVDMDLSKSYPDVFPDVFKDVSLKK